MGLKSLAIRPFSGWIRNSIKKWSKTAVKDQLHILNSLVEKAKNTSYGKDHNFASIRNYKDFKNRVPVRDYEGLRNYVDAILKGEKDVLWPGLPKYFAKTSGTTSGVKYIPLTEDSMPNHINTARNALLNYIAETGNYVLFDGKMIFLSGSPELNHDKSIPTGRLSGIVNHEVPTWVKGNQLPSYQVNCIDEWEDKLEAVIAETLNQDMRLISGIPPWVQMYYERILEKTGKQNILEVFPNYQLFMYGGVNYEPYRAKLESLVGRNLDCVETYPASEGFIAFQDSQNEPGLLLNSKSGIFYEFVPVDQIHEANPQRLHLGEVELGVDYALIINNNAGLWGYNIGDMVRFVSLDPYRIVVSGRVKHFISAFGEHVIGKEVETAMLEVAGRFDAQVIEFTVAPQVTPPEGGEPYHEWFVEFDQEPKELKKFATELNASMCRQNIYYDDLISGKILKNLVIRPMQAGAFRTYMKTQGKLGGQNKVPRLSNDRKIADKLAALVIS